MTIVFLLRQSQVALLHRQCSRESICAGSYAPCFWLFSLAFYLTVSLPWEWSFPRSWWAYEIVPVGFPLSYSMSTLSYRV